MTCKKAWGPPSGIPPEAIVQDSDHRFVNDAQITQWTDGTQGQGQNTAMVFRRSDVQLDTPVGGSWATQLPDGGQWLQSPPPGIQPVWVSTRHFTSDGASPQAPAWTYPVLFVQNGTIGSTGANGLDGADGADGNGITWLGTYPAHPNSPSDGEAYKNSADKKSYVYFAGTWYTMTEDGADGAPGADGTSLVWLGDAASHPVSPNENEAYKNTTDGKSYIWHSGAWHQMTIDGIDGTNGSDGISIVWAGELASAPMNPETNWVYKNTGDGIVYIYNGTGWDPMTYDGSNGSNGLSVSITYHDDPPDGAAPTLPTTVAGDNNGWHANPTAAANWMSQKVDDGTTSNWGAAIQISGVNGLAIEWKGLLASAPADPQLNWVYKNTTDNKAYIYNGTAWELMVLDGSDGAAGANGTDGLSVYITYHDDDAAGTPPTPPTDVAGTTNNWHTNPTAAAQWMSQKIDDGTGAGWGLAIAIRGSSGPRGSDKIDIEESDAAATYVVPATVTAWTGTLTDAEALNVARDAIGVPSGTGYSSDGYLRPNDKITVTDASNQLSGTRIYTGTATNDPTGILASDFSGLITEVIDGNLLVQGTVSADRLGADVISGGKIVGTLLEVLNANIEGQIRSVAETDTFLPLWEFNRGGALILRAQNGDIILQSGGTIDPDYIAGLGAFALLDQITSANIGTYMGTAAIAQAYMGNASIGTAQMIDAAVETLKIKANAVTVPVSAYTTGSIAISSLTTLQSVTINPESQPVVINWSVNLSMLDSAESTMGYTDFYVYRGGTQIYGPGRADWPDGMGDFKGIVSGSIKDSPGAGSHTYTLKATMSSPGTASATYRTLLALGVKR